MLNTIMIRPHNSNYFPSSSVHAAILTLFFTLSSYHSPSPLFILSSQISAKDFTSHSSYAERMACLFAEWLNQVSCVSQVAEVLDRLTESAKRKRDGCVYYCLPL